ncbi:bacteriophage N4 adsorption protein B [Legionella massiliensis]|uniref:Bacteriophage N4 adsorption protein B n=1 Tax=Legionella massiliensis TaxID=1034943 RepID=A0A078KZ29_9GAMM|nr:glycosyltransferase [Legionella massiliensis]CDZ78312.1 bacteriophage N4 adsorption protein B [Legionella massiliensis]CEE14050.1 bacteriophage N4 adsorption protein B [Legionella massiliensis]
MPNEIILMLYFVMWYFLVGLAVLYSISAIDDLFIDIYYWLRYFVRLWKTRHYEPLTYEKLVDKEEQLIAILVPCWHEDNVIITMLKHNCYAIDYRNYYIFVGVYPNDPATINAVQSVANIIPNVQCIIGENPGPTNKAANLNGVYRRVKEFEKELGQQFEVFVFHDSEDVIHPLSFKLYNYLIPRKDMIQIPVFPLEVNYWNFTHWLYADEFAENHTKDIIVRESIRAHVPSAGVGTAFSRHVLQVLEDPATGGPFSIDSLTEDYHTSLAIRIKKLKQIFVSQSITRMRWERKGLFRKGYVQRPVKEYIATRALFPMEYSKAVRQKSRWIIGIIFQEWSHIKWPKEWSLRFTLAHDRKGLVTHFINGFGYIVFLFWVIYSFSTYKNPEYPSLQEQLNIHTWVWWLIIVVTIVMCERLMQRAIAIVRVYQYWLPAFLSIPRAFYGNVLNLHAIIRAVQVFNAASKPQPAPAANSAAAPAAPTGKGPVWDKTDHQFPGSHILTPYRRRLGDLLLENKLVNKKDLERAILEKQRTGERLGQVLFRLNMISNRELLQLLSTQYNLRLFPQSKIAEAKKSCSALVPKKLLKWLEEHETSVISFDEPNNTLVLTIEDPTNELLIEKIINHIQPYKAQFVLIDNEG